MRDEIAERFLDFAARIINLVSKLSRTFAGRHIAKQLLACSTSAGANYEEACGAESRADFIHKMQVVLKELRESLFWLRLISRAKLVATQEVDPLIGEASELARIVGKSVVTARRNRPSEKVGS